MKNKNVVALEDILKTSVASMGNLGTYDKETPLVPYSISDHYLVSLLSNKFGNPIKTLKDVKDDCSNKFIGCMSYAYECEMLIGSESDVDNAEVLIGCLLTDKTLESAKSAYPRYIILSVANPKKTFVDRGNSPEELVRQIIDYIGDDPNRSGVVGTPERVVRMWGEIYGGYDPNNKPKITTFVEEEAINSRDIIFDKGEAWSNCEHHMAPFKIEYCFAYIPNPKGKLLGLSKISRVVRYCSQKLQLQERIGADVVDTIVDELTSGVGQSNPPLGVAIMLKGAHSCKTMRGVKTPGYMISTYTWGVFEERNAYRKEFLETAKAMLGGDSVIFG